MIDWRNGQVGGAENSFLEKNGAGKVKTLERAGRGVRRCQQCGMCSFERSVLEQILGC